MMALSIRQPWAWLILHGQKDFENRDWPTRFRGRFLIHASRGMTRAEYDEAKELYEIIRYNCYNPGAEPPLLPPPEKLQRGGIVGSVELVDCRTVSRSPWFFGKYGFRLTAPTVLPFCPMKGKLMFFEVPLPLQAVAA